MGTIADLRELVGVGGSWWELVGVEGELKGSWWAVGGSSWERARGVRGAKAAGLRWGRSSGGRVAVCRECAWGNV